uniref:Otogelin n=1 Tax=Oryzias latipes TaxID=8090 RepID=A0A3P9KE54_ORYLA
MESFVFPGESCDFPCLNGGQCVQQSCDCSLYHATGLRCQTVVNLGFEREMTCRTWGQYNFETFDGLYYYFPGRCSYTLLKDSHISFFVFKVHNDPECSSAPYTCQRSVSIFLPWEGEIRLHASNVTFKGRRLQLPHHLHHLQLEQISQYVLVTQQQGFTLAWEGRTGSVYIKLSPDFVGGTCGLCGNFNAEVQDDMTTSYGLLTQDVEMFGNSWMEMDPHQNTCPPVGSSFPSPCNALDVQVLMRVEEVCSMLLSPPFQSCHDFVSPLPYMASCSNDLCSGDVVCQVLSEYARACAHADHPLLDWRRDIPQCVPPCPAGLQYRECISCCPATCSLERTCIDSRLACLDGCYCPDGLIFEDGGCVEASDCPCEHHGVFYPAGQVLQEECNNCTCVGGVWNCTDHSCPGECSVTGDMFFQSFDGRIFTFSASCQYVLVKSRLSGKFTVTIQNAPCGPDLDGACIQSVSLVVDEDPRTEMTLSHMGEVFMAGQYRISLPYYDDAFHIQELSSMFLQVRTAFGLQLQYSWAEFRLYLQADERWKDDTVGLCGTFNGNIQDDFLSPSGMIESTPQLFGNSWKVSSACSSSLSVSPIDPCDSHQQAVSYASSMCDVLNQDLFAACHDYLSPAPFHQQCRANTCRCGTPCLCPTLAHYARHCRKFSVIVDFRSHIPDCAVSCPATMEYSSCVSSCQRRCSSLAALQRCGEECEEGCACPQGSFYNHRTHTCVHRSQCPCSLFGADYEPGDLPAQLSWSLTGFLKCSGFSFFLPERLCPAGQLYQNCSDGDDAFLPGRGVACERTCESHLLNIPCSSHDSCVSGCICPHGLLKHGDECFEPAACPCLWKGKEYFPGDRVSSPCYQCACQHGTFQCAFRPCPSMCTAYGDRHYRTFDGLLFDYVGACKVYLVKSSADAVFSVTAENVDCFDTGVICKKYLLINVGASLLSLDDHMGKPNPSSVIDRNQRLFIWQAGLFTVVHFPEEDITVLWDHKTTVHVQVGPHWQGRLSGLCGNFDLKTVNEMRTPENMDSPTPQEFGNSWTATECVNSPDIRHPCSLNPLREPYAKHQCAVLLSEVFQTCHPVVDVSWFYENCLADTCACSRGGDCECFCTSVAAYAQRCCHEGVPVDWRSPSLCRKKMLTDVLSPVLGKGPIQLLTLRDPTAVVAASRSGGLVFLQQASASAAAAAVFSQFMMTPGLSKARRHDSSRVSFEAAERPNYFLHASQTGQVRLAKWENSERFWTGATFIIRRNTWIPGFDSFESQAKAGFFLHAKPSRVHLLKYKATESFRRATLFRLADSQPGPRCQWRYDACVRPCFRTCSDPSAKACTGIPQVEGCLPFCPPHMVLDEVTHRCVYMEDCKCSFRCCRGLSCTLFLPQMSTNKTTQQTLPTDLYLVNFTTTTIPKILPTNSTHIKPASMAASSVTTNLKTTREVTITELPESKISGVSTKAASPLSRITHTTYPASSVFWHGAARVTDKTPTSGVTSRPLVVPESFNMSANLFTTQSTTISVSPREKTATPLSETTESSTSPVTTDQTAKPWHPPHRETSFTTIYKPTVKVPSEVSSESVVTSTTVPQPPVTPTTILTSSTGRTTQTTTSETPTAERGATTTRKLVTTQPMPGTIESPQTTASTTLLPPTVVSTTLRPVVAQRITEVSHAETGRLQFTTKDTTPPPPSVYPLSTRISDVAKSPTTIQDTVITLLVSTPKSEPTTIPDTTKHTTTSRTTASVPVATKVTSNITSTDRSTIRPTTASFITRTKPSGETTTSTTVGPSTVVPSHSPAITSRVSPAAVVNATTHSTTTDLHLTTIVASDPNNVPGPSSTSTSIVTTSELTSSGRVSPAKEASVSLSKVLTPTLISEISGSNTTLAPSDPTDKTTAALGVTSPSVVVPSAPAGISESDPLLDSLLSTVSLFCSIVSQPPYVEIVDECTKYICVKNQLVLFNKSQSCPFSAEPPNCGLLGFAVLVNGDKCCPKWDCPCRCSMFPDLNVITFDGNSVAIYKAALYIVTQLPNETVTVMVQECPADSESLLLWNFTNLCLVSLNITHQSNHVLINRLQRRVRNTSILFSTRFKKFGFEIYDTGNMYLIRSPAGLKLQWYHSTGMMVIETDSKVPTMGLCGVCDGDPTDDLTLPNGSVLGAGEDPALFIDSWQVSNTTSYISQSRRRDLNCSTSDCSTCLSMLENATFTACHAFVPPSTFCEVWVRDSEYVNNQCVALAAYVASCHKFNICIEWRRPNYCPFTCAATLRYQACLPACTSQSCPNHDFDADPEQCSGLTEGCVCPEGTLLHRQYSALCIPPEKCACTDSAGVPRANGEVWKASRDGCCMYRCDNDTILPVQDDCSSLPQPVCQRAGEMIISMAHESSCCPHKVCLCNQSLCDQVPPICKYGEKLVSYHREDSCCPDYVCECDAGLCVANIPTCREDQTLVATRADGSCCVAHICMCSSCLLTVPVCQDGEVIAVNNATTDRCCPVYQCVCEPYRCPQLSCPLGMSVVAMSTPNRCCPKQTCECACEKIPFPICRLGETAQLDQAFLVKCAVCGCAVREEVCVFGERSVLQPGQTLLEHRDGGLCITRQCSQTRDPASGFYLLQTSSVNCSAHCQANQIYVPPKDQSTCCGACKNISCLYQHENGTTSLYKPGRSWASNCMKFDCSDTQFGPTLITYAFSCPPFNETECMKIGGTVVNYMDGCCKTCKEDGKSCQKVTVRMTIRKNDCRSNRPVNIVSCDGKCPSASIYNYNINTYARFCKCCRETGLQRRSVQLYCSSNATWVTYSIQEPTDCSCQWS